MHFRWFLRIFLLWHFSLSPAKQKNAALPATVEPGHLENNEIQLARERLLMTSHSSLVDTQRGLKTSTTPQ